jgi:hypothetical protein
MQETAQTIKKATPFYHKFKRWAKAKPRIPVFRTATGGIEDSHAGRKREVKNCRIAGASSTIQFRDEVPHHANVCNDQYTMLPVSISSGSGKMKTAANLPKNCSRLRIIGAKLRLSYLRNT